MKVGARLAGGGAHHCRRLMRMGALLALQPVGPQPGVGTISRGHSARRDASTGGVMRLGLGSGVMLLGSGVMPLGAGVRGEQLLSEQA